MGNPKLLLQDPGLKQLQAIRMNLDGKSYLIRTDLEGVAYQAFKAAGVQPPKRVLGVS